MNKILVLLVITFVASCFVPASAETVNYRIKQEGSSMVIVPYYSTPSNYYEVPQYQKMNNEVSSPKIPFYQNKMPKGLNRTRTV